MDFITEREEVHNLLRPLPVIHLPRSLEGLAEGDLLAVRGDLLLSAGLAVRLEEVLDCYAVLRLHFFIVVADRDHADTSLARLSLLLLFPSIFPDINRAERADLPAAGESVGNLPRGALSDLAARVHDEDLVRHIDLAQMHLVQHLLRPLRPDLSVAAVPEERIRGALADIAARGLS